MKPYVVSLFYCGILDCRQLIISFSWLYHSSLTHLTCLLPDKTIEEQMKLNKIQDEIGKPSTLFYMVVVFLQTFTPAEIYSLLFMRSRVQGETFILVNSPQKKLACGGQRGLEFFVCPFPLSFIEGGQLALCGAHVLNWALLSAPQTEKVCLVPP